jgi:hypothetical protein
MRSRTPPSYRPLGTPPRPFPTRGVPSGWKDPWDDDPLAALRKALPHLGTQRRHVTAANLDVELMASVLGDGRWEAHVAASSQPLPLRSAADAITVMWPSVNGPTAAVALDALEAELRAVLCGAGEATE